MLERISLANVVWKVNGKMIWMINKRSLEKWNTIIALLWWWALLYNKWIIEEIWWVEFEWDDCRFKIDSAKVNNIIQFLLDTSQVYETDIIREMKEELTQEYFGAQTKPILHYDEFSKLQYTYYWFVVNKAETRNCPGIITNQIMRLFEIKWPPEVLNKILWSPIIIPETEFNFDTMATHSGIELINIIPKIYNYNLHTLHEI